MTAMSLGRVLVVGGCGCLGSHVVKQLRDGGEAAEVFVLARRPDHNIIDGVEYIKADITNKTEVEEVFKKVTPNVVIHTAASMATVAQVNPLAFLEQVNIEGTRNVLEASQKTKSVKAFVFSSSPSVVHSGLPSHVLIDAEESLPVLRMPEQHQMYSHTKGVAETLVLAANGKDGVLTVSIRPSGLLGERDLQMTKASVERARTGRAKTQIGDNTKLFDVTYVGNAAEAHILAAKALLRRPLATGDMRVDGEAFFVTNGEPLPFWDVSRMFADAAGHPVPKEEIKVIPVWLAFFMAGVLEWAYWVFTFGKKQPVMNRTSLGYTIMQRTFSIEKAKKRLGYSPKVSVRDGIKRGVDWYDETFPNPQN